MSQAKKEDADRIKVAQSADLIVRTLITQHQNGALDEFYRKMRKRADGTAAGKFAIEDALNEKEHRLVFGRAEALLCYYRDADNYGRFFDPEAPAQTLLVGTGDAEKICQAADISRQRIQDLCDQGRLPWVEDPYHGRKLIVRKAVEDLARSGNPDYR